MGADGAQLTVGELVRQASRRTAVSSERPAAAAPAAAATPSCRASTRANLLEVEGEGHDIPPFKGEIEVRVQTKVLRVSGRFREGPRAGARTASKFPLQDIAHARLRGTIVDLWVRTRAGACSA